MKETVNKLTSQEEQYYIRLFNDTGNKQYRDKVVLSQIAFLYNYANKLTRDPDLIEDMVQEGFLQVIKAFDSYDINAENSCLFRSYYSRAVKGIMAHMLARSRSPFYIGGDLRVTKYNEIPSQWSPIEELDIAGPCPNPEHLIMDQEIKQIARELFR